MRFVVVVSDLGPSQEWHILSKSEDLKWWKILTGIYRDEQERMGSIRPAFSERAVHLLKSNGRDRAE